MLDGNIYSTPPQHVAPNGCKFWLDRMSTQYAANKGLNGVQVAFVEEASGRRTRLISQNGEPVFESQQIEAIGVHLDIMAIIETESSTP